MNMAPMKWSVKVQARFVSLRLGSEPGWVLEYDRQQRRAATETRKREMEERIARVREKERKEKLAARNADARPAKRRVSPDFNLFNRRKTKRVKKPMISCWMIIILMRNPRKDFIRKISSGPVTWLPKY